MANAEKIALEGESTFFDVLVVGAGPTGLACAMEAQRAGAGCPVVLEATHEATLETVPFELLLQYAVIPETLH